MNALAEELNDALADSAALRLLSDIGRRMYFPKGIVSQSAEADEKAHRFNATIGMAYEGGEPMILDSIRAGLPTLSPKEAVAYAPTAGTAALRARWRAELDRKNPSLRGRDCSLPVVVPGLTAAVSAVADLFLDAGDEVVLPDLSWPNYRLIIEERKAAKCATYPTFTTATAAPSGSGMGFNVDGLESALRDAAGRSKAAGKIAKAACILNFPNNPTGYTPTLAEADAIVAALIRVASEGVVLLVLVDDAYFGLQYEEGLLAESIFARLAWAHPNILAVKADGPTKEDYVWGFRLGFLTFGSAALGPKGYEALVKKLMGLVRSSVSNSSAPAQNLILKSFDAPGAAEQKARLRGLLKARYERARDCLHSRPPPPCLKPLPFNSGYFMSFECLGLSAEALRKKLLNEKGIGTVSIQDHYLRIAFSSVEAENIEELFAEVGTSAAEIVVSAAGIAAPVQERV
ncbi:MAG: aminotransferase class I/II-fold pyridoxal phosphate-dependent enzyme [Rectinemataceae bacterium]|jgi:aspartate/methionine/tyrosine aminotransferase